MSSLAHERQDERQNQTISHETTGLSASNGFLKWALSSEFVSSSIPSSQILIAHAQPFRRARDLVFCLKVPLDSLPVWASSGGSGKTARMRRLTWTFAARISDKYQIRLSQSKCTVWVEFELMRIQWESPSDKNSAPLPLRHSDSFFVHSAYQKELP